MLLTTTHDMLTYTTPSTLSASPTQATLIVSVWQLYLVNVGTCWLIDRYLWLCGGSRAARLNDLHLCTQPLAGEGTWVLAVICAQGEHASNSTFPDDAACVRFCLQRCVVLLLLHKAKQMLPPFRV